MYRLDSDLKLRIAAACEVDVMVLRGEERIDAGQVTEVDADCVEINHVPYRKALYTFWDVTLWGGSNELPALQETHISY
ncbi:hypothetical protein [Paenibacillus mucilaginosus]|uniref:Uncharacterized protein n=3 Tax=Paenibacillus mucilaginosus TaxID=61624 RepID=H6NL95_9BACL|nr:hypothetical protein [Paenibacillus mucilaginosus]AFH61987.1 hypothetical protein B2K_14885 [Paenibacillus mucilaginosus K02]AEI41249.1 hypothetical protein KNP414_02688 [Paenibacillus mucilaginosus KNP414]AFC29802.1 hypothetical protein PM3016_2932 [Paenibacillus mucilaginosus 3016]MCG7211328.1 hypothetical protein [Paenibacillus mucilaginosus]WDM30283.1 hypothetical protein KCX80_14545 [Paenibacillus mucilaginosus]